MIQMEVFVVWLLLLPSYKSNISNIKSVPENQTQIRAGVIFILISCDLY